MRMEHYEMNLTLDQGAANAEMVELLFGLDPRQRPEKPRYSVVMDLAPEEVSGEPKRPAHVPGLIARLTRRNERNLRKFHVDRMRWLIAGKPTKTQQTRFYLPNVSIDQNV
jgi:hypothetical protein